MAERLKTDVNGIVYRAARSKRSVKKGIFLFYFIFYFVFWCSTQPTVDRLQEAHEPLRAQVLGISRNNWADVSGTATIQLEMMSRLRIRRGLGGFSSKWLLTHVTS